VKSYSKWRKSTSSKINVIGKREWKIYQLIGNHVGKIFLTLLSSAAAANIDTCSRCLVNKCVIYCQECPDPKSLCSACDEEVHQKYPLHDRDGIYNGYYKALPPKLSVTCDGQHKTISMYPTLYCVTLVYNRSSLSACLPAHIYTSNHIHMYIIIYVCVYECKCDILLTIFTLCTFL
jgi:hypothetical protein